MVRTTQTELFAAARQAGPSIDDCFAAVRDTSPFAAVRVTEPSPYDVDVPAIHAASFDRLVTLADRVMTGPEKTARVPRTGGTGAMLLGGAGIGKSHLLSRLYRWARETKDRHPRACYVYLHNIMADPERLPRYLLKCVVSLLVEGGRGPWHETPLYRLVDGAVRHALGPRVASFTLKEGGEAYARQFAESMHFPQVHDVLLQFWRHARPEMAKDPNRRRLASDAVAWLSGEEIDEKPASAFGLKGDAQGTVMLRDDQEIEHVLLVLARLARANGQPFILCVDQVDNLDPEKVKALARFLQAVIDHAQNLLAIVSGVKQTMLEFRAQDIIPEAAWDRLAEYKVELLGISPTQTRHILEARLERFHEPFVQFEPIHNQIQRDALFPLGERWLNCRLDVGLDFRPRDILIWARDGWEQEQDVLATLGGNAWLGGWPSERTLISPDPDPSPAEVEALIDTAVDRKIEEQLAQRRLQPGSLPPDAGNLAGLVESILKHCDGDGRPYTFRSVERMKKKAGRLPPYDLKVRERREGDGKAVLSGVVFVTNIGLSATTSLRRLLEDEHAPDHRILVTDHERRPLKVGAQGVEYYKALEKLGPEKFQPIKINFEQYATLDALEGVVGMARVGDLEIEAPRGRSRPVSETEVVESHHRKDRYRGHPLLRPLLTEEPPIVGPGPSDAETLNENDVRQYVMAQLAWMMGSTAHAIAKGYAQIMPAPKLDEAVIWPHIKTIAEKMHVGGLVHAQPLDDDLYLLLRK